MHEVAIWVQNGICWIEDEDLSRCMIVKDEKGVVNSKRYSYIERFIAAKKCNGGYEILYLFNNGVFAKWLLDREGYCRSYKSLKETPIISIAEEFRLDPSFLSMLTQYRNRGSNNDMWVAECVFPGRRNGFFVEAGACDGISQSSCYILEKKWAWEGICIEPHDLYYKDLVKNRSHSECENLCLDSRSGKVTYIQCGSDSIHSMLSGTQRNLEAYRANSSRIVENGQGIEKDSISLYDLLRKHQAPKVIHYLAMDIEGSELPVLETFPFDEYIFLAISIKGRRCNDLLLSKGYINVTNPFNVDHPFEQYFIHESIVGEYEQRVENEIFKGLTPASWNQQPSQFEEYGSSPNLHEEIISRIYNALLVKGDVCIDGGAHTGLHTFPLARLVGDAGKVYGFEALPHLVQRLQNKLVSQSIKNVHIVQKALSNELSSLKFLHVKNAPGMSGIKPRLNYGIEEPEFEEIEVKTTTIDTVLSNELNWRFCKLDLEGGEYHCLMGAVNAIQKFSPFIIFENGRGHSAQCYGYAMEDWFLLFEKVSYKIFDIFGRPFSRADWDVPYMPWYFIAVKAGSADEEFVKGVLPTLLPWKDLENVYSSTASPLR